MTAGEIKPSGVIILKPHRSLPDFDPEDFTYQPP